MEATAKALVRMNPAIVYSSTEKRAVESGQILSQRSGIPLKTISGMQERNWGEFSGKSWPEIESILKPMSLEERYKYVPPKGESWQQFEERLIKAINQVLEAGSEGSVIVIVTHGGTIRALMPYLLSAPKEESFKHDPDNASITIFEYESGKFSSKIINNTDHLRNL